MGVGIHVGSRDFADAGSETSLIILVNTTNHPSKNTPAKDSLCDSLS